MAAYEEARRAVADALRPVAEYCQRGHETANAADPAHAGRLRHITRLDALVGAVVDYGAAAELERLPCAPDTAAFIARIQALPAFGAALERPPHLLAVAGSITSHCLPLPSHARPEPV